VEVELTVLGACGSFGSPAGGGACSGYLVREGTTAIWMDCGNGTFANLQRHLPVEDLAAIVITHVHPDHCVDLYGLHVLFKYGLDRSGLPLFAPPGSEARLATLVDGDWGGTFAWSEVDDGDSLTVGDVGLRFSRTDHPPPTLAVELSASGRRAVYTADTGPDWSVQAFAPGAELVVSEATFQRSQEGAGAVHLSARQAGEAARAAAARRLVITHLWPGTDPVASLAEASEAYGDAVTLAAPHQQLKV
jgi:ribonuclease BN (tRNA processing enzyme)